MKNNATELVFILDESGSMYGLKGDTIGGFNSMIDKQKQEEGKCYVSTVLFNTDRKVIHDRVLLENVKEMTEKDYQPNDCTALLDAIGYSINHITKVHKYIREEDVPNKTLFVIITDGYENASRRYKASQIREMISGKKEKDKWEFMFIGANIDAVCTAETYGIDPDMAVNYLADHQGSKVVYDSVSRAVGSMRKHQKVSKGWNDEIAEDFNSRK